MVWSDTLKVNVYSTNLISDPTTTLRLIWYLKAISQGALLNALGALALGAPVGLQYFERTISWSLLMSSLTEEEEGVKEHALELTGRNEVKFQNMPFCARVLVPADIDVWYHFLRPKGPLGFMLCLPTHGAIIGAWFGTWPMPLDWEHRWQKTAWLAMFYMCIPTGIALGYVYGGFVSFSPVESRKPLTSVETVSSVIDVRHQIARSTLL
ncbi:hypothetical protein F3Y22_tig00111061pilonHSYRG00095 [Hibiscus syriacus]|uniref:Uncharacterized protein n=1 Tax=Hibiscus syriacus TaxID=106335 RepID=A0A6A2Z4U7_HIBSY|nr:hypothetical protein F3Y22_tig00111061pilonHSYRG00095 [Hibiscus syriacus]